MDQGALARALRFQPRYFLKQGFELADRRPVAIEHTLGTLSPIAQRGIEQTLLKRLEQRLSSHRRKLLQRWPAR